MKAQRKGSILAVDDTPANLQLLSILLLRHDYRVQAVMSDQRAIEMIHSRLPEYDLS